MATLKQKVGGVAVERTVVANYDDSTVVHKSGNESVAGIKTFTESPLVPSVSDIDDASMKAATTKFVQDVALEKGGRVSSVDGNALERKDDGLAVIVSPDSDNTLEKTSSGLKVVTRIVTVTGDSGTLFESELEMLKADKRIMLERDSVVFQYTSTLTDEKMRYTAVNRFVGSMDYLCVILVDAVSGDWAYEYSPLVVKTVADLPKTELVMPTGITSDPSYYWCKNNTVHITLNRLKSTTVGEFTIPILEAYLVPSDRQIMGHAYSWDDGSTAGFTRVTNIGIRARFFQTNKPIWGSIVYAL